MSVEGAFTVWSPSTKPCSLFQRTTSGSSTLVPEECDMTLERTLSQTSTMGHEDGGHSSGDDLRDGPSLTEDGRAVDLDAGAPLFFAHDKVCSPSWDRRCTVKEGARRRRLGREELAAARVAAEQVCSLDASGVVHGEDMMAPPLSGDCDGRVARFKLFRRKLLARRRASSRAQWPPVCMDWHGKALMYLDLGSKTSRNQRLGRRLAARCAGATTAAKGLVAAIDERGQLRRPRPVEFARYLFTLAPDGSSSMDESSAQEVFLEHRPRPAHLRRPAMERFEFAHYLFALAPDDSSAVHESSSQEVFLEHRPRPPYLRAPATERFEFAAYLFTLAPDSSVHESSAEEVFLEHRPRPAHLWEPASERFEFAHYLFTLAPDGSSCEDEFSVEEVLLEHRPRPVQLQAPATERFECDRHLFTLASDGSSSAHESSARKVFLEHGPRLPYLQAPATERFEFAGNFFTLAPDSSPSGDESSAEDITLEHRPRSAHLRAPAMERSEFARYLREFVPEV